jgi:broad specificity phosphatase PhoE
MLELYLIRHGESVNNKYHEDTVGGISKDTGLTREGLRQAELLGKRLRESEIYFDKIFSSAAIRASKTCDIASSIAEYDLNIIIKTEKLFETNRGEMVGMKRDYVKTFFTRPDIDPWSYCPKNGESNQMAGERMYNYLKKNLNNFNYDGRVAVFGHGNIFRAFLKIIMDEYRSPNSVDWHKIYTIPVDNTSITILNKEYAEWHTERINDIRHLK